MEQFKKTEKDFRKWISFNNETGNFQNLYDLYNAVDKKKDSGNVRIGEISENSEVKFIIEQKNVAFALELSGEISRKKFLDYVVQHYFPNQDIEDWYKNKLQAKNKLEYHTTNSTPEGGKSDNTFKNFKVHPKENKYYKFRVFFSGLFYALVIGFLVMAFLKSATFGIQYCLTMLVVVGFVALINRFTHGFFIGIIKGNAIRISEHQYPDIFKIVKYQAAEIGLKTIPDVYASDGNFNAFVTKFARKNYLMLYSEVIETALKGDLEVLKFVVAHELGHIKRKHLTKEIWLTPSLIIPFLKSAHSRGCEYTCDRIGYHFSGQGAIEGILILSAGKEIYSKINISRFVEQAEKEDSFWVWYSEKFLSHPHVSKRLLAVKNYDRRGY